MNKDIDLVQFEKLQSLYHDNFSLGFISKDFTTKVALISLINYLTLKVRVKKPSITYLEVIKSLNKTLDPKFMYTLAIVCEDFAYGCTQFPTFGIEDKQIPSKVREILAECIPF